MRPPWLSNQYDINARVSDADLAEWQKQGVTLDEKPMLREMLQTMLADRCHLIAHMVPGPPISGWSLELGKHAPRLTESKPGKELPAGLKLPDGGVWAPSQPGEKPHLAFYAATMDDFASFLSDASAGQPVQDHTGLTGHYDLIIDWISDPDSKIPPGYVAADDPDPISHWNIEDLGIKRVPIRIPGRYPRYRPHREAFRELAAGNRMIRTMTECVPRKPDFNRTLFLACGGMDSRRSSCSWTDNSGCEGSCV